MLVDTSGFLCLLAEDDFRHKIADSLYEAADERVTHNYVLAELVPVCQMRGVERGKVLAFILDIMESEEVGITWVDESLHWSALALLRQRSDKEYSLTDAVSFLMMRERGIREALTTDHHFEQEGFVRLLET